MPSLGSTTAQLNALAAGDKSVEPELLERIYDDLRALAARHLQGERRGHTLDPTALAHEAYLRLIDQDETGWDSRAHFFAIAARMIRRILIDHARKRRAAKRGAGLQVAFDSDIHQPEVVRDDELLALDEALQRLAELHERHRTVVELRYFGSLTFAEIGEVLGVSDRTAREDWRMARAWLREFMGRT